MHVDSISRILIVFISYLLSCSFLLPTAHANNCDSSQIVSTIKRNIELIDNYSLRTTVSLDNVSVNSNISGKLPNLMRIKMAVSQGNDSTAKYTITFDGTYQWVEITYPSATEVLKIRLADLVQPKRPFDTGYYLQGSGLLNGEDFPSSLLVLLSIYDVSAQCSKNIIRLSGPININNFKKYAAQKLSSASLESRVQQYISLFGHIIMVYESNTLDIKEYQIGKKENPTRFKVQFDDIKINHQATIGDFVYNPPTAIKVIDITKDLLDNLNKK